MAAGSVLALDFGSTTGWAVGKANGNFVSGIWDIAPRRGETAGMRYIRLRRYLEEILKAHPDLALVVYEQAHQRGAAATEYAIGCVTELQKWIVDHPMIQTAPVHSATVKKYATDKGNAKKPEMLAAAAARGWKPKDDNECDALWILDYAIKEMFA